MIRKWSCSELWRSAKSWSIDLWRVLGSLRPPDQKAVPLISKSDPIIRSGTLWSNGIPEC
jgi:hypothetical protein